MPSARQHRKLDKVTYCVVDVAALVVVSVGGEVGGVELAASMMTVRVEVAVLPALSVAT